MTANDARINISGLETYQQCQSILRHLQQGLVRILRSREFVFASKVVRAYGPVNAAACHFLLRHVCKHVLPYLLMWLLLAHSLGASARCSAFIGSYQRSHLPMACIYISARKCIARSYRGCNPKQDIKHEQSLMSSGIG
jgi:hypothetical protein